MLRLLVLSAFAYNEYEPLPELENERKTLAKTFEPIDSLPRGVLSYKDDLKFDFTQLVDAIRNYRERLYIFHFSGHANGTALKMTDGKAYSEGLSKLLGRADNLKLVFLNACATKGHVKTLLDAGVPVIIATSAQVEDKIARIFSKCFYEEFVEKKRSFNEAFSAALAVIQAAKKDIDIAHYRDIDDSYALNPQEPAWGVYFHPKYQEQEIYNWYLEDIKPFKQVEVMKNPYIVGSPIKEKNEFHGRKKYLDRYVNIQSHLICIFGIRRIGKTSLLFQLETAYEHNQTYKIALFLNLLGVRSTQEITRVFERAIKQANKKHKTILKDFKGIESNATFLETLQQWSEFCVQNQMESLILIDEAENLARLKVAELSQIKQLLLSRSCPLSMIITGSRKIRELGPKHRPFYKDFEQTYLSTFYEDEARDVLSQNQKVQVSLENLQKILHYSGRHPYFLQYIADELFENGRLIDLDDKPGCIALNEDFRLIFEDEFNRLSEVEQKILHALAFETFVKFEDIKSDLNLRTQQLDTLLYELEKLSFIRSQNRAYALGNIFWEKYLGILRE